MRLNRPSGGGTRDAQAGKGLFAVNFTSGGILHYFTTFVKVPNFSDYGCVVSRKLRDTFGRHGETIAGSRRRDQFPKPLYAKFTDKFSSLGYNKGKQETWGDQGDSKVEFPKFPAF